MPESMFSWFYKYYISLMNLNIFFLINDFYAKNWKIRNYLNIYSYFVLVNPIYMEQDSQIFYRVIFQVSNFQLFWQTWFLFWPQISKHLILFLAIYFSSFVEFAWDDTFFRIPLSLFRLINSLNIQVELIFFVLRVPSHSPSIFYFYPDLKTHSQPL